MRKNLYFITESCVADWTFYYYELLCLSEEYNIHFISLKDDNIIGDIPNTKYYYFNKEIGKFKKILYFFKYFFCKECYKELKVIISRKDGSRLKRVFRSMEYFALEEYFHHFFMSKVFSSGEGEDVYYSYWSRFYALNAVLHRDELVGVKTILTRHHGFDLFENVYPENRQPFKEIINKGMDKLVFVAESPMNYYMSVHPEVEVNKVILARLGTKPLMFAKERRKDVDFLLVSCSNVIPLKRVDLIVKALALLEENIHWIHFGDGSDFDMVLELANTMLGKKSNITYELRGNTPNKEIRKYYENNVIDCFITTTQSEGGCPVAIMEALSAGAPVIGTNVGDVPIMVSGNGIIISENPSIEEIAESIITIINMSSEERKSVSNKAISKFEKKYNSKKNSYILKEKGVF